ncbi:anthranilate synthase component I [Mechercharimyces sp. CAU 1602]|uniref:anthranilate synthase component I n=1 Tax=Mechercharimyces sp. CAU 1602 TaxID=2973933 RepID=UPI002162411A|nr:anthranilate synthase component I [Mechercharimyces sp. CAU 1602]MCS1350586.1 anthranilate synthase component I [Mechercharimyces sp. CAU 1602]
MYFPSMTEVRELAKQYALIPVGKKLFADTQTPIRLYQSVTKNPYSFLLESAEGGERRGRWSFMGTDPFLIFRSRDGVIHIKVGELEQELTSNEPVNVLQELVEKYRSPQLAGAPPFLGGAVGYVGFEAVTTFEAVPRPQGDDDPMTDDIHVAFYDRLLIYDHLKQDLTLVLNLHVEEGMEEEALMKKWEETKRELDRWTAELQAQAPEMSNISSLHPASTEIAVAGERIYSNTTKEQYMSVVERAQEHIRRGDIFQIVPSQRWTWEEAPSALAVYRVLRTLNPSPYMYHLSLGEEEIVGTSPEMLVRVQEGKVETRPIAGTRPRGASEAEDEALAQELLADEKERAEHVMLVDLGRNDLGRVARYGSVKVTEEMKIEKYSHVMHMVSHVVAELAEGKSALDAFMSCFPAGTVSGAPKVKAMQLLGEMEPGARGVYAGAICYLSFSGNLDSCIAIRTLHFKGGRATIQAGGGVVADSNPEKEYEESCNKARGMIRALNMAEHVFHTDNQLRRVTR